MSRRACHIKGLVNTQEAADRLGFHRDSIKHLYRKGDFPHPAEVHDKAYYWLESDLQAWAEVRGIHFAQA